MKHILIIDDDIHINDMLDKILTQEGYRVSHAYSGTEALLFLSNSRPDLILLDLMLPGLSGEELLPQIADIPVIVMSAKADVKGKVALLLNGAADYITKPFEIDELLAYIYRYVNVQCNNELLFEQFTLDIEKRLLKRNGEIIAELTPFENNILTLLATSPNEIVPREKIIHSLWEDSSKINELSLNNYIVKLRKIFQPYPSIQILTYRNQGFKLQID